MKKSIIISSLGMRFYKHHGWSLEILNQYLLKGKFLYFNDTQTPYWIAEPFSNLDVYNLWEDGHVGELRGRDEWDELLGLSDLEVLEERNWQE